MVKILSNDLMSLSEAIPFYNFQTQSCQLISIKHIYKNFDQSADWLLGKPGNLSEVKVKSFKDIAMDC